MSSEAQIEANRRNALLSTGPKTEEGKRIASLNSYKHGFCAALPEKEIERSPEFQQRRQAWGNEYAPANDVAKYALDHAVAASFRMDRCEREFNAIVANHAHRARSVWDLDQQEAATAIAVGLAKDPMRVTSQLRISKHGCELMIEMWELLGEGVAKNGQFTEAETSRALDLLGLPVDLREGRTPVDLPDAETDRAEWLKALIAKQIARLKSYKDQGLDEIDDSDRHHASRGGGGAEMTKRCQLILRYERAATCEFHKAIRALGSKPKAQRRAPAPYAPEPAPPARPVSPPSPAKPPRRRPSQSELDEQIMEILARDPLAGLRRTESISLTSRK